ncbi:MAG: hypothetical protein AB8G23_23835 [Myxococcota bacterium]
MRREGGHRDALADARAKADAVHAQVSDAVEHFNALVAESVPHLQVHLTPPRIDDKHLHAVEFDLERGRHRGVITVKTKREVTLVGPFKAGKPEGPCRSFPFEADDDLEDALGEFLTRFLEEASAP